MTETTQVQRPAVVDTGSPLMPIGPTEGPERPDVTHLVESASLCAHRHEGSRTDDLRSFHALTHLSHELRTPLAAIKGYLELLREAEGAVNPAYLRYLDVMDRNAERLHSAINAFERSAPGRAPEDLREQVHRP